MRLHRSIGAAVAAIGISVLAVGCTGAGTAGQNTGTTPKDIVTGAQACTKYGDITLKVGFSEAGESILNGFNNLVSSFEKDNPKVKVDVQAKDFTSSLQTIKLAMSSDTPPDVMQGNEGWSIDGALWKAGLILNLDPYAKAYGWDTKFPKSALTVNQFTADGKTFGQGNLTGLPQGIQ